MACEYPGIRPATSLTTGIKHGHTLWTRGKRIVLCESKRLDSRVWGHLEKQWWLSMHTLVREQYLQSLGLHLDDVFLQFFGVLDACL